MANLTLLPAYGRDYTSARDAFADWQADKDWEIASYGPYMGRYVNRPQVSDGERITLRYKGATQLVTFVVGGPIPANCRPKRPKDPNAPARPNCYRVRFELGADRLLPGDPDWTSCPRPIRSKAEAVKLARACSGSSRGYAVVTPLFRPKFPGGRAPKGFDDWGTHQEGPPLVVYYDSLKVPGHPGAWSCEVNTFGDPPDTWTSNALRFATPMEAQDYGKDLASRWTACREYRATFDPRGEVTHRWGSNGLQKPPFPWDSVKGIGGSPEA